MTKPRIAALFLLGDSLSLLGNSIIAVALPWLVLLRTGDVAAAGVVAAVTAVPALLAAVLGGVIIDRVGRRRISIIADIASALSVAALVLVDLTLGLDLGWFILLGLLGALIDVPGMTARESLLADVSAASRMPLERLAGIREGLVGLTFLLGPALAGIALLTFQPAVVITATAACSGLAALCTALLPGTLGRVGGGERAPGVRGVLHELVEGGRALAGSRVILALTVLSTGAAAVFGPLQGILLPAHFLALGAPDQLGYTLTALAVGSVLGAGCYALLSAAWSRRAFFVAALLLTAVGLALLALLPGFWLVLTAMAVLGIGSGLLAPLVPVLVAEQIPEAVRGRVLGLQNAALMALAPVAMLGIGLLAGWAGLSVAAWVIAGAWALVCIAALLSGNLRDLGPAPTAPEQDGAAATAAMEG